MIDMQAWEVSRASNGQASEKIWIAIIKNRRLQAWEIENERKEETSHDKERQTGSH